MIQLYVVIAATVAMAILGYLYNRNKRKALAEVKAYVAPRIAAVKAETSVMALVPKPERTRPLPPAIPIIRCKVCGRRVLTGKDFCAIHAGKR